MPTIQPDRKWRPHDADPHFLAALDGTARTWVHLLKMLRGEPPSEGLNLAYDRAILALVQLPIEYLGPATRFDRSRWRAATVETGVDLKVHCEHPWTKKRTKTIVLEAGKAALANGERHEVIVEQVAAILAARQDTVLLPHARLTVLGVRSEKNHDGLAARYSPAVEAGTLTLIDRMTGERMIPESLSAVERASVDRVDRAVTRLAGASASWTKALREAVQA